MGSGGIIILVLFAVSWIVQAIVAQANKKKEQERLAELARRRRQQEAMHAQGGAGGAVVNTSPTPSSARSAPIPQPFGTSPPTSKSTTSGRPGDDLAARRAAQIEELRRRREAQLEQMRRKQAAPSTQARTGPPPSVARPSSPPPGVRVPPQRPQSSPSRGASTLGGRPAAPAARPMPQSAAPSRQSKRSPATVPASAPLDAAYAQPDQATAAHAATEVHRLGFDAASLRDADSVRKAFVMKELLDFPLALRHPDVDRVVAW